MTDDLDERRNRRGPPPDTGNRRRRQDAEDDWRLKRDKYLFTAGLVGVTVILGAALFTDIRNPELVLALLTLFGGLLGAPTILAIGDRARDRDRDRERQNGR